MIRGDPRTPRSGRTGNASARVRPNFRTRGEPAAFISDFSRDTDGKTAFRPISIASAGCFAIRWSVLWQARPGDPGPAGVSGLGIWAMGAEAWRPDGKYAAMPE